MINVTAIGKGNLACPAAAKLQNLIDEAQKSCRARCITVNNVALALNELEDRFTGVAKCAREGLKYTVNYHARTFARCYDGTPTSTFFEVLYHNGNWYVTDVFRARYTNTKYGARNIPDATKRAILATYERF